MTTEQDHDLLIKLDTRLERLQIDMTEMKDNTTKRVSILEVSKQEKSEADANHKDHEVRIRAMERERDGIIGGWKVIDFLIMGGISGLVALITHFI